MKAWTLAVLALALWACAQSTPPPPAETELKNHGPAPELKNEVWLNTDRPLRLADLRGKVVLIDFWTFG